MRPREQLVLEAERESFPKCYYFSRTVSVWRGGGGTEHNSIVLRGPPMMHRCSVSLCCLECLLLLPRKDNNVAPGARGKIWWPAVALEADGGIPLFQGIGRRRKRRLQSMSNTAHLKRHAATERGGAARGQHSSPHPRVHYRTTTATTTSHVVCKRGRGRCSPASPAPHTLSIRLDILPLPWSTRRCFLLPVFYLSLSMRDRDRSWVIPRRIEL